MGFRKAAVVVGAASAMASGSASADELFRVTGTLGNGAGAPTQNFDVSFDNARSVIEFTESERFRREASGYRDDFSTVNGNINFRGLDIGIAFPQLGGSRVEYSIPEIGLSGAFTGFDRDDSLEQLGDYLLENSGDILRRIQRALIRSSPNDPTAGNPNSLQSQMVSQDFAFGGFDSNANVSSSSDTENRLFIGLSAGTFKAQGVRGRTVNLPLAYTVRFDDDPRYQLQFALPISYLDQSGAKTGTVGLGAGFQFPVTSVESKNQWYLTPRVSIAGVGSADAGAASILANLSMTSRYVYDAGDIGSFTLANMAGYNFSVPFKAGDVKGDYGIKNIVAKNGVMYEKPLDFSFLGSESTSIQAAYAMTNFGGTDLYMSSFHDVSLTIGTRNAGAIGSLFRLGVNGTFGRNFNRYVLSFGYAF